MRHAAPVSVTPEEITIPSRLGPLAGLAWGSPDAPPVLCLHGWLDNAASFSAIAPLLPGLRLVALDLPGHGRSAHRAPGETYHFIDAVADAWEAILALGWSRPSLLGHSMGAAISSLLAGTFPDKFEKLILLEGLGPLTANAADAPTRLANAITDGLRERGKNKRAFASFEEAADRVLLAAPMERSSAITLLQRGLVQVEGGWSWAADSRLRSPSRTRLTEEQVAAFFARIACPTLVVRATQGWPIDVPTMERRLAQLKDVRVAELEGRHHVHLDRATEVAAIVAPFLGAS